MLALLLIAVTAGAQQDPLFGQYINNLTLLNPAYAGYSRDFNGSLVHRKQWAGFDGSPQTTNALVQMAIAKNKAGVGLMVQSDKIGSNNTTEVQGLYAYHLPVSTDWYVSFGLQAGATNYQTDYSDLVINPNDPKFVHISEWNPSLGAGIMVRSERFLLSVSMPEMLSADAGPDSIAVAMTSRNVYALAASSHQLTPRLRLKPYVMLRSAVDNPVSVDAGAALRMDDSYTIGLFTRSFNTIGFNAQLNLGDVLRFGYNFEIPTGKSVGASFTTHEVMLGVRVSALKFHDLHVVQNF